jgi:hypothetical protein
MKQTQWQSHIDAFNKSGLSKWEYADNHQLIYHQFVYWSQKLNKSASERFIQVKVKPIPEAKPKPKLVTTTKTTTPLGVLEFPSGIRLVIHSPELLAQLTSLLSTSQDSELGHANTL